MNAFIDPNPLHEVYEGLHVLDLSQGIAGPYCAQILGQMGAQVTKVEPLHGDWGRSMGVPRGGFSAIALAFNRGKRSLALDAQTDAGREVLHRLAARADVVVQSFRPGVADRLGLGYATLRDLNPRLVYASISGFGLSGPYADRPGTDSVVQALTGLTTANCDGAGLPQRVKPFIGDLSCGVYTANAIGGALFARERGQSGRHIDVSLLATMAALQNSSLIDHALRRGEPATSVTYPQGIFSTQDGYVLVFAMNNAMFAAICRVIGRDDWLTDPRMDTPQRRIQVGDEINAGVAQILRTRSTAYWTQCFRDNDILYGEVKDYDQFQEDEQVRHLGLVQTLSQPGLGDVPFVGLPGVHPASGSVGGRVPAVGEDTQAVLRELDYSPDDIRALAQQGIIQPAAQAAAAH